MDKINFNVSTDLETFKPIVSEWFYEAFDASALSATLAEEIDIDEVAERVADSIQWDDVSEYVLTDIRHNYLGEIADYLKDDIQEFLVHEDAFGDYIREQIDEAINNDLAKRIDSLQEVMQIQRDQADIIQMQHNQIVALTEKIDDLENNKIKKMMKKIKKGK